MNNRIIYTLAFYAIAFVVIFILIKISPNAKDGGLGLGGMALMLLPLTSFTLMGIDLYYVFTGNGYRYLLDAGIHFTVITTLIFRLFL